MKETLTSSHVAQHEQVAAEIVEIVKNHSVEIDESWVSPEAEIDEATLTKFFAELDTFLEEFSHEIGGLVVEERLNEETNDIEFLTKTFEELTADERREILINPVKYFRAVVPLFMQKANERVVPTHMGHEFITIKEGTHGVPDVHVVTRSTEGLDTYTITTDLQDRFSGLADCQIAISEDSLQVKLIDLRAKQYLEISDTEPEHYDYLQTTITQFHDAFVKHIDSHDSNARARETVLRRRGMLH